MLETTPTEALPRFLYCFAGQALHRFQVLGKQDKQLLVNLRYQSLDYHAGIEGWQGRRGVLSEKVTSEQPTNQEGVRLFNGQLVVYYPEDSSLLALPARERKEEAGTLERWIREQVSRSESAAA